MLCPFKGGVQYYLPAFKHSSNPTKESLEEAWLVSFLRAPKGRDNDWEIRELGLPGMQLWGYVVRKKFRSRLKEICKTYHPRSQMVEQTLDTPPCYLAQLKSTDAP